MAVDIKRLFNEELPAQLAKYPEEAKQIGKRFQLNIGGEGEWHIDVTPETGPKSFHGTEHADKAHVTIDIAGEDFQKLMENPQANGMTLFFAGKLKLKGDQMLAMKLGKLLNLGQ